jgi:hypothetical protein
MLKELLDGGWSYHDSQSARLALELEEAVQVGVAPGLQVAFLDLATHTIGEHLSDWPRALKLGRRALEGHLPTEETARAWERLYVAAVLSMEPIYAAEIELTCLAIVGNAFVTLVNMRFMLANALIGSRRVEEGAQLYRSALDFAERIKTSPQLDLSIAVASNNLAWSLYETPSRTADTDSLMELAADTAFTFWGRCGTWINEERALYLKTLVALAIGQAQPALSFADTALALISANGKRPLDAALLHLARARSLAAVGDTDGKARALVDADAAADVLTAEDLKQQFIAKRAEVIASLP